MVIYIRKKIVQRARKFHKTKINVNFYIFLIEIDVYFLVRNIYIPCTFYDSITLLRRRYNKIKIIEITIPLIILNGITPETIIIFKLCIMSVKFIIMPYSGNNTK